MEEKIELNNYINKLKFDAVEYNFENLSEKVKNLAIGLQTLDVQLKMYWDIIIFLNVSKNYMLQKMKSILNIFSNNSFNLKL